VSEERKTSQIITVNGKQYDTATFTNKQLLITNHCLDLEGKIAAMQFQLEQLQVSKEAFVNMLSEELKEPAVEIESDNAEAQ
jgi:hypothetical protein